MYCVSYIQVGGPGRLKLRPDDHIMTAQDDSVQLKATRLKLPKPAPQR